MPEALLALKKDFEHFAHVTSHDLRDPVRHILNECEHLKERLGNLEPLDAIVRQARLVLQRVECLKIYASLFHETKHESVDLAGVLQQVLQEKAELVQQKQAQIICDDHLPVMQGDEGQLKLLFASLIDNALVFSGEEPPVIHIHCRREGERYHLSITDNGIGLDEVYQPVVFLLFQKMDESRGGPGMGLAYAKKVVENHGGLIRYTSQEGEGMTIDLSLVG